MTEEFTKADNEMARKLQLAVLNAIYKQIQADPLAVPAATLAVAERLLARYNVGLGWGVPAEAGSGLTDEEKAQIHKLEAELGVSIGSDMFDIDDRYP